MKKLIWRVALGDEAYPGNHYTYLLSGENAGAVESRAMKITHARDAELSKDEAPLKPYTQKIELIGELDD